MLDIVVAELEQFTDYQLNNQNIMKTRPYAFQEKHTNLLRLL
jgi:hypothetical protein